MKKILLAILAVGCTVLAFAQESPQKARIRFIFENPKLQPSTYVMDVYEDGSGHFQSKTGTAAVSDTEGITAQPLNEDIKIKDPLLSQLFKIARSHNFFDVACESTKSKVAFTGKKALMYTGPDGDGSCTFNWSRDQQIMKIADDLIATAYTLQVGQRLSLEHEHNRLGLDSELESLEQAVKQGQAEQIQNIAPQLQSIADDSSVMERARNRARQLLSGKSS
jgi:hypothetical protein